MEWEVNESEWIFMSGKPVSNFYIFDALQDVVLERKELHSNSSWLKSYIHFLFVIGLINALAVCTFQDWESGSVAISIHHDLNHWLKCLLIFGSWQIGPSCIKVEFDLFHP